MCRTLAAWPVPFSKADPKTGHLAVHLGPTGPDGSAKTTVQLVLNPSPLLKATQAEIAAREGKPVPQISSLLPREHKVEELHGRQSRSFEPLSLPCESSGGGEITLVAWMPEAKAKVYVEQLRTGQRHAEFRVTAKLYATREKGKVDVTAGVAKIKVTKASTQLDGNGGASKSTVKDNTVTQSAASVARNQQRELTAKVAQEIVLIQKITGDFKREKVLVDMVKQWMQEQAFGKERDIDTTVAELQADLRVLGRRSQTGCGGEGHRGCQELPERRVSGQD